jgi:hypothetical protein
MLNDERFFILLHQNFRINKYQICINIFLKLKNKALHKEDVSKVK